MDSGRFHTIEEVYAGTSIQLKVFTSLDREIDRICESIASTSQQDQALDLSPYFGVIWPAARGLAKYLGELHTREPNAIRGLSVLEVGCGLALPSLLLAKWGVKVTVSDFHPEVWELLTVNEKQNDVKLEHWNWDWRTVPPEPRLFDWVLGSDILYERKHPEHVARAMTSRVKPGGRVILADPARPYVQEAVNAFRDLGWNAETHVYRVAETEGTSGIALEKTREVFVFVLAQKG